MPTIFQLPKTVPLSTSGTPLAGAKAYFFETGTNNPKDVYHDFALATPWTQPVTADGNGVFPLVYMATDERYRLTLEKADASLIYTVDDQGGPVLTQAELGSILYPQTTAETSASVTPTNYAYPPGDLRRYGCDVTGGTNNATQITNAVSAAMASGGTGYVYHPGGNIAHSSQIIFGNGLTVYGEDRNACIFTYTGTGSAWRSTNNGTSIPAVNTSGFGKVNFKGIKIVTSSGSNVGAAIELNACGYSYYEVSDCWLTGTFKYGVIVDGCEVSHFHHNIISVNDSTAVAGKSGCIWLVNGPDRIATQNSGYTNVITINDNQCDVGSGGICIIDDGGSNHHYKDNNLNGGAAGMRLCGVQTGTITGQDIENAGVQNLPYNILFTDTQYVSGTTLDANRNLTIENNNFAGDMQSGGSELSFGGGTMHAGFGVRENHFRFNLGRTGAAIDVTKLANSVCEDNTDDAHQSQAHYTGIHNDVYGNKLAPPTAAPQWKALRAYSAASSGQVVFNSPNFYVCKVTGTSGNAGGPTGTGTGITDGSVTWDYTTNTVSVGYTQGATIYGDTRYPHQFKAPVIQPRSTLTYSASMVVDVSTAAWFEVTPNNGTAFAFAIPSVPASNSFYDGQNIAITVINTTGGALGAITFTAGAGGYRVSASTAPANNYNRTWVFGYSSTSNSWKQMGTPVDVPN